MRATTPAIRDVALVLLIAAAAATALSVARAADAPPPNPQQVIHHVHGLFAPDCEADLRKALKALPDVELVAIDFDHAEATFRYDPAVAFRDTAPEKIVEQFNHLLRNASGHMMGIAARSTTPRDKLTRVEILVESIDCRPCCLGLYEMLATQEGVEQVGVYLKDGRVSILIDLSKTDVAKLQAYLRSREVTLRPS